MAKWKTVTKNDKVSIPGVTIETEWNDGNIVSVVVGTGSDKIRVAYESYSMRLSRLAAPDMVDRWAVTGKCKRIAVSELFECEHEAKNRADELNGVCNNDEEITIAKVSVSLEEAT